MRWWTDRSLGLILGSICVDESTNFISACKNVMIEASRNFLRSDISRFSPCMTSMIHILPRVAEQAGYA